MCNANTIFVYQNSVNKVLRRESKLIPKNNAREGGGCVCVCVFGGGGGGGGETIQLRICNREIKENKSALNVPNVCHCCLPWGLFLTDVG